MRERQEKWGNENNREVRRKEALPFTERSFQNMINADMINAGVVDCMGQMGQMGQM